MYMVNVWKTKMLIINVHTDKWLDCDLQRTDPASRQRGRPTETGQQIPDPNSWKGSNIWSDSILRHTDWLTFSRKVTLTLTMIYFTITFFYYFFISISNQNLLIPKTGPLATNQRPLPRNPGNQPETHEVNTFQGFQYVEGEIYPRMTGFSEKWTKT
jgi:hypothetical protein